MLQTLNLNWIRSFEAAARHLSFTEAAHELGLTQAGVSQHVRLLEQVLGASLLVRLPRRLQLTDTGEAYLHAVRECLFRLRASTDEIFPPQGNDGLVTIRCNVALATHWLSTRIGAFLDENPRISLRLLASVHGADSWEGVDMELRYDSDGAAGLRMHPLKADSLFPVCGPALARRIKTPADLLGVRLIHVIGNRRGWSDWFEQAGVDGSRIGPKLQVDTSAISLALAEQEAGVALGHSSLVEAAIAVGRLVRPFPLSLAAKEIFHLVMPGDRMPTRAAETFTTWILRQ